MDGCPWCVDRYVKDSYFECPFLPMKSDTSKYHSNHFTDIVADFHEDRQPLTGEHYVTIAEVKLSLSSAGTRLIFLWLFRGNAESGQRVVCWKVSALVSKTNENVTLLNQPWCSPTIQYIHSMSKTARSSRTEKVCYLCFIVTWHTHTHTGGLSAVLSSSPNKQHSSLRPSSVNPLHWQSWPSIKPRTFKWYAHTDILDEKSQTLYSFFHHLKVDMPWFACLSLQVCVIQEKPHVPIIKSNVVTGTVGCTK